MQETQILFSQNFYSKNLSTIGNIHFTAREIDVIACILSARRTSKIAYFLSINSRTVETHIRNILAKSGANTREGIIDFIEAFPDKIFLLRKYYALLRVEAVFEKNLKDISRLNQENNFCFLLHEKDTDSFAVQLKSHLNLAGITVSRTMQKKEETYVIFILSKTLSEAQTSSFLHKYSSNKILFLLQKDHQEIPKKFADFDIIDCTKYENYYFSFFIILKKLLPHLDINKVAAEIKEKYKTIHLGSTQQEVALPEKQLEKDFLGQIRARYLTAIILAVTGLFGAFIFFSWNESNEDTSYRSDLILPVHSLTLNRPEIIDQIKMKLKKQDDIQTVALVGVGGAGKTTIARQYACKQKVSYLWEINAETKESLKASFENIAKKLANTEEYQKTLREIQALKDPVEKEEAIIHFVKSRLKAKKKWLLIYDNVETFTDIQKYFPYDSETWGNGKVIITTRDSNIDNNRHIGHTIVIGELNTDQKFTLFTKIMRSEDVNSLTVGEKEEIKKFLEEIPPFPLDVSIAAYYLKATQTSFKTYLENITKYDSDFTDLQKTLLNDVSEYTKTRYGMITMSLRHIINAHKEFKDLLLFVCLLDSQNIPKELLSNFKSDVVVDNFILNLRKYSLLTNSPSSSKLSLHRSTQTVSLVYLTKLLNLENNKKLITNISEVLGKYIDSVIKQENIVEIKSLIHTCEIFLNHKKLLNSNIEGIIKSKLGVIHFFCSDNIKAKDCLEESLLKLKDSYKENPISTAFSLGYLGNVVRDLGDYAKAKFLLEKSLSIYGKYPMADPQQYAYFFVYLNIVETYLGNYKIAKDLLETGLIIHKNYFPKNKNYLAWVSGRLGVLERISGNYEKAEVLLEASLSTFQKDSYLRDMDVAWALQHLSVVYIKLGKYEKAKQAIAQSLKFWISLFPDKIGSSWIASHLNSQDSTGKYKKAKYLFGELLKIYKTHFHESYLDAAWHLGQLGILYRELGKYKKAKILIEQHKIIVEKNFGENHLGTALVLNDLGAVYFLQGDLEISENLMNKAYLILEKNKHLTIYQCLENLSALYIKKSSLDLKEGKKETSQDFQNKAITYLKQALDTVRTHFPKNSAHEKRIQENLDMIEKKRGELIRVQT